jgi:hypothetical protein
MTSMTNVTAGAYADMPLFMFRPLEYLGVDYEIDVEEIDTCWAQASSVDVWSRLIVRQTADEVELLDDAPRTGIWKLDDETGAVTFRRTTWHSLQDESEAFYLRVLGPGDYRYKGAGLGVIVTRSRLQDEDDQLTERARTWIDGINAQFSGTALQPADEPPHHHALAFKTA